MARPPAVGAGDYAEQMRAQHHRIHHRHRVTPQPFRMTDLVNDGGSVVGDVLRVGTVFEHDRQGPTFSLKPSGALLKVFCGGAPTLPYRRVAGLLSKVPIPPGEAP